MDHIRRKCPGAAWMLALLLASTAHAAVELPDQFLNDEIVTGLAEPNSFAFLPDGRVLLTEQRTGKVRMVVNDHIAVSDPVVVVPSLNPSGYERGLQGIAVDPDWPLRPYVYLGYTRSGNRFRIIRYTASGDLDDPAGESLALSDSLILMDDILDNDPNHNSGCLRFGPDRHLFVSLGEDEVPCAAFDSTTLRGAIVRLWTYELPPGGGPQVPRALITPLDNPIATADTNAALVWAYGMRNPWRFQIDPITRLIYSGDVGEADFEEFNEIAPGDWLGWPYREGFLVEPRGACPEPGGPGTTPFKEPLVAIDRGPELFAVISAGVYRPAMTGTSNWPVEYDGQAFYGEYYTGNLFRMHKVAGVWEAAPPAAGQPDATRWMTGLTSSVDYQVGPDGSLWYLRQFASGFSGVSGILGRIRYVDAPLAVDDAVGRRALVVSPNPFRTRASIALRLDSPQHVRAEVLDLMGRRVRTLADAEAASGELRFGWDGSDDDGRTAPPGLYLVRVEHAAGVETGRILRVR